MRIGQSENKSALCIADANSITVRGMDLCEQVIGQMTFTEFFVFHLTSRRPTENQLFMIDAVLVALAEHGLMPSVQASRMTLAAAPESMQGAVAAGILGCGSVIVGTTEGAGQLLSKGVQLIGHGNRDAEAIAIELIEEYRTARKSIPGFGHPLHQPRDPRATRLLQLGGARGVNGRHCEFLATCASAIERCVGKALPINVTGATAAVMLDCGFPLASLKAVPILARTAGILAHLQEEALRPIGFALAHHGAQAIEYDGPAY